MGALTQPDLSSCCGEGNQKERVYRADVGNLLDIDEQSKTSMFSLSLSLSHSLSLYFSCLVHSLWRKPLCVSFHSLEVFGLSVVRKRAFDLAVPRGTVS